MQRPRSYFSCIPDVSTEFRSSSSSPTTNTNIFLKTKFYHCIRKFGNMRTQLLTKMLCSKPAAACNRWMVTKAANRAAVHGSKLPVADIIPKEEVEAEIHGAIEEKERKRREIENSVDSYLKNWQVLHVEDIVCSK